MNTTGNTLTDLMTVKNTGLTDITAGTAVIFDPANPASGDTPPGITLPTAGGGITGTAGVTRTTIYVGKVGSIMRRGRAEVTADGAITAGGYVQVSDTIGKLGRVKAKGVGVEQLGQAIHTAADGELLQVDIVVSTPT